MIQSQLNDAAIALDKVLAAANVKYGIFGGYAISILVGPRESKDVDCLASASKQQIVALLDGKFEFKYIDQARTDYAAFLWSDKPKDPRAVLVEIFVDQFQGTYDVFSGSLSELIECSFTGSQFSMSEVVPVTRSVVGQVSGTGFITLLDSVHIFKGKLRARATRNKYHDAADLRYLEGEFRADLRQKSDQFNLEYAGLAMKRSPELERPFFRIGIGLDDAKARVAAVNLDFLAGPQPGDVQRGLLAPP